MIDNDIVVLRNKEESKKFLKRYNDQKYIIPLNVINNINNSIQIKETPTAYNELSKKIKNIINNIDIFYLNIVKDNFIYNKFKSIHIANLIYKNQQTIKTNDYNRTYSDNKHLTSIHAEHSVIITCCKLNLLTDKQSNTILCVIRYDKKGGKCNSRPCAHCIFQIKKNNIKNFLYSINEELYCYCKIL